MKTGAAPALPSWLDLLKRSGGLYLHDIFAYPVLSIVLFGTVVFPPIILDLMGGSVTGLSPMGRWGMGLLFLAAKIGVVGGLSSVPLAAMMVVTTGEEREARGALRAGWARSRRLAWVLFLYAFLVVGGAALLIVPGVLMAAAFVFGPFLCVLDGVGGLDALSGSREFFRGQAAPVAVRALAAVAPLAILPWISIFGAVLACLCAPFSVLWLSCLFQDIKPALGTRAYSWSSGKVYFRLALLGHLLMAGLLVSSVIGRGAAASPPDSAVGDCARRLRMALSGVDGFFDDKLPLETKEFLERAGRAVVTALVAGEKRWESSGSAKAGSGAAAPPAPSVSAGPPSQGAPSAVGETREWLRDFTVGARRKTIRVLDWLRGKIAGDDLREAPPKPKGP